MEGFEARNSGGIWHSAGIHVTSNDNIIENNTAIDNLRGILLEPTSDNRISGNNVVSNSGSGIHLYYSSNNTISSNTVDHIGDTAIVLDHSWNRSNTISANEANDNDAGTPGILQRQPLSKTTPPPAT